MGDGNWGIQTEKGFEPSKENVMYRVSEVDFDIIHIQHKPVAERICNFYPAKSRHFKSNVKYNFQNSAKEILNKIKGDLKNITINSSVNSIPIGAVDQWINNEDFLISAEYLASAKNIYFAKGKRRDQIGDVMI